MIVFALCLNTLAHAKDTAAQAAARKTLVAAYATMDRAVMKKDLDTIMSYVAPDFQFFNVRRVVSDRARFEATQRFVMQQNVRFTLSQTTITKFQWRGPDAIVWTTTRAKASGPGGVMVADVQSREYWGQVGKRWMMRQSVELGGKATLNGQPFLWQ